MPRYFFHVRDDGREYIDDQGIMRGGPDEARAEAVRASGEMLKDLGGQFWDRPDWRMWVTDENGETVCSLTFSGDQANRQPDAAELKVLRRG